MLCGEGGRRSRAAGRRAKLTSGVFPAGKGGDGRGERITTADTERWIGEKDVPLIADVRWMAAGEPSAASGSWHRGNRALSSVGEGDRRRKKRHPDVALPLGRE